MLAARVRLLTATLWVGSLWTVGYIVAPTLFSTLADRVLAGTIAGKLFRIEAWLSVFCGVILIIFLQGPKERGKEGAKDRSTATVVLLAAGMLVCTLLGYFALHPFMESLRAASGPGGVMESAARTQFGILHGVSSGIYLLQSLLGVALILKLR